MCGLRTRPRTDVDPPRVKLPSAGRGAYRLAAPGAMSCYCLLAACMWSRRCTGHVVRRWSRMHVTSSTRSSRTTRHCPSRPSTTTSSPGLERYQVANSTCPDPTRQPLPGRTGLVCCETTKLQITPWTVVFVTIATAIGSLGHGLHTLTVVPTA